MEIENGFVEARRHDSKVTQETLHVWIALARAVSATMGSERITVEAYQRAMALDYQRRFR